MADELRREFEARLESHTSKADALPREVRELDERIARLRDRRKVGDPDLTDEELAATIDRALAKREGLVAAQRPALAKAVGAKVLAALPGAAKRYQAQIEKGLNGNPAETAKARQILREMLGGQIELEATKKGLVAHIGIDRAVLVKAAGSVGSGGRI